MRLTAYLRVSTDRQADEGNGLDVQERAVRRWAKANGHKIVSVVTDAGVSGAKPAQERPGLTDALLTLRARQAQGLVLRDLDRLARSVTVQEAILAEVWAQGGSVFTATGEVMRDDPDDPMRTALREMAGVFAGLERRLIVKRLRDGRAAKAARGGHAVGAPPYGWRAVDGALVKDASEQAGLRLMMSMRKGGCSTRDIATALAAEGHPTKRGGRWTSPVVARILARTTQAANSRGSA
jgi:DNA invertase Pin-like site-specific DNA recombinase